MECQGAFLHAARSTVVFGEVLINQQHRGGCFNPEEICTLSQIESRLRAVGVTMGFAIRLNLRGLLENAGATLSATELHQVTLSFADAREAADFLIRTAGHLVSHRRELIASCRWQALHDDLAAFAETRGERYDERLAPHIDYLVTVADRRAWRLTSA